MFKSFKFLYKWQRNNYLRTNFYDWVLYLRTRLFKQWKSVKMGSKQQAYTHVVKSTWNKALSRSRKHGYGGKAVVEHATWRYRKCSSPFAAVLQPWIISKVPNNRAQLRQISYDMLRSNNTFIFPSRIDWLADHLSALFPKPKRKWPARFAEPQEKLGKVWWN